MWAETCALDRAVVRFGNGRELARSFVIWRGERKPHLVLKAERLQRVISTWSNQVLAASLQGWIAYTQAKRREREEVARQWLETMLMHPVYLRALHAFTYACILHLRCICTPRYIGITYPRAPNVPCAPHPVCISTHAHSLHVYLATGCGGGRCSSSAPPANLERLLGMPQWLPRCSTLPLWGLRASSGGSAAAGGSLRRACQRLTQRMHSPICAQAVH